MIRRALFALSLVLVTFLPQGAAAQSGRQCFTETGYCISGRIREFWQASGGLPVFGFPITPLQTETIEGRVVQTQWFERGRLELHPENRRPYDVQLGRLGADLLASRNGAPTIPAEVPGTCQVFSETGLSVCGQILAAWRASGLELDGRRGASAAESLALFGLPLAVPRTETLSDGRVYTVQWFERGRFEIHPEGVLLGLLGREYGPVAQSLPAVPASQTLGVPVRVVAAAIGMDVQIVGVGLDASRAPIVPDHEVGWYNRSGVPGGGENIVLWGHVLRFSDALHIPAPFARLKELREGDRLTLYDAAGASREYTLTKRVMARPSEVAYILPQGRELLTMVSCYGDKVYLGGEVVDMSHRLILVAESTES